MLITMNNTETVNDYKVCRRRAMRSVRPPSLFLSFTTDDTYTLRSCNRSLWPSCNDRPSGSYRHPRDKTPVSLVVADDDQCADKPFTFNWTPDPAITCTLGYVRQPDDPYLPARHGNRYRSTYLQGSPDGETYYIATLTAQQGVCPATASIDRCA